MIERIEPGARMSQAVVHNGVVYLAGQVALDAMDGDVAQQTRSVLARTERLLEQAGSSRRAILSATIWLANMDDFEALNTVWDAWISPGFAPARATVQATLALPAFRVEVAMTAAVETN